MFYSISGKIVYSDTSCVAIECAGVAFKCTVSLNTLKRLGRIGENATLYTHLSEAVCLRADAQGLSRERLGELLALTEQAERYLRANVSGKHVLGLYSANTVEQPEQAE